MPVLNSVNAGSSTYHMCSLKLPIKVINQIDSLQKQSLGHGSDNKKGGYLVAWNKVCRQKDKGGLGVINLRAHNSALIFKHVYKFFNRVDVPWVNLIRQSWGLFGMTLL